mgnify:FL=1
MCGGRVGHATRMNCVRCGLPLVDSHCLACGTVYVPACPYCGNREELEQLDLGANAFLRCPRCDNRGEFRMVAVDDDPAAV